MIGWRGRRPFSKQVHDGLEEGGDQSGRQVHDWLEREETSQVDKFMIG